MDIQPSQDYLNDLKQRILKLNNNEYLEIYKIVVSNDIVHTKNNNGVFINLFNLNTTCIKEIEKLLKYYYEINNYK